MRYIATIKDNIEGNYYFYYDDESVNGDVYAISYVKTNYSYRYPNYTHIGIGADRLSHNDDIAFVEKYPKDAIKQYIEIDYKDIYSFIEEKILIWSLEKL